MVTWAVTAHLIKPADLGVMTAVLAAITATAIAMATMVGDAYTALLPAVGIARPAIFRRGQRLYLVSSTVGGLIAGIATIIWIDEVRGSVAILVLVLVGTVLTCSSMLQNNILAAIGRARWLVGTTTVTNVLKIGLLCTIALTFKWHSLELATVISAGAVALTLTPIIHRIIFNSGSLPEHSALSPRQALREFDRFIPRSFVSTVLGYAIFFFTPFLVTAFSDAKQGALFALALPLAQTLDVITTAMGTSLTVHAAIEPGVGAAMARSVLIRALPTATVGAVAIAIAAPAVLQRLNPAYGSMKAFEVIAILCAASVVRVPFSVWAALQRSRRNLRPMLIVAFAGAVVVVSATPTLSHAYGAVGGALGLISAYLILSGSAVLHTLSVRRSWRSP
jgi:O-antigen/teichoic acid export membrane protein